jgi:diguanylate cyclase (GGDEF)-like protein
MTAANSRRWPAAGPGVSAAERRVAVAAAGGLIALALGSLSFANVAFHPDLQTLFPTILAGALVAMLVSAALLYNQYRQTRAIPYAFLATAYGFGALALAPYLLVLTRLPSPAGFGGDSRVVPWLWVVWHAGFALAGAGYVWSETFWNRHAREGGRAARIVRIYAGSIAGSALLVPIAILCFSQALPQLAEHGNFTQAFRWFVELPLLVVALGALIALAVLTRCETTNRLWFGVVLVAWVVETLIAGLFTHVPYGVAWYADALASLVWPTLLLVVQLVHANDQLTAFAAVKESLVEETLRDPLTGLYNRRGFDVRYEEALRSCAEAHAPLGLLAIDLDHFKAYNDHYGHVAGDEALRKVAAAMEHVANRPSDASCRMGGEEFAIVLRATDLDGASAVAERLRGYVIRMRIPHVYGGPQGILTLSIGVAVADAAAPQTSKELFERADKALYRAKRLGRNRFATYRDYAEQTNPSASGRAG